MLIINNLVASMMWHRLNVLDPPKDLLQRLKKTFVNFFLGWLPLASPCCHLFASERRGPRVD